MCFTNHCQGKGKFEFRPKKSPVVAGESSDRPLLAADLQREMAKRVPVQTNAKLRAAACEHMAILEQTQSVLLATFTTAAYAGRLNASLSRIDNGHAGKGRFVQARAEKPAMSDLRRSAVHEVTSVGAQSPSP